MAKKWTAADVNALMREEEKKSLQEIQKRNEYVQKAYQNNTISNDKQQPVNKTRVAEKKKNQTPALDVEKLLSVDVEGWKKEMAMIEEHYAKFGDRLPAELAKQLESIKAALGC